MMEMEEDCVTVMKINVEKLKENFVFFMLNGKKTIPRIEGLVITKSELRSYDCNSRAPNGVMFCFTIRDETGDVEVTVFENAHSHRLHHVIMLNKIYSFKNFNILPANKEFSLTVNCPYELLFTPDTQVTFIDDGPGNYLSFEYPIQRIKTITTHDHKIGDPCNIFGVCVQQNGLLSTSTRFSSRPVDLREIIVRDANGSSIQVALWDYEARKFDITGNPYVYIYGARLREFQDKLSLGTVMNTMLLVFPSSPPSPRFEKLCKSLQNVGSAVTFDDSDS